MCFLLFLASVQRSTITTVSVYGAFMKKLCALAVCLTVITGCSGMRETNNQFSTHAESIRILGYAIPEDDQAAARALVPKGATITDVQSTPADWHSVVGFIGNLLWINQTVVSGTK